MALPLIRVTDFQRVAGNVILRATPDNAIEDRPLQRRFYFFDMLIENPFDYGETSRMALTDNNGVDMYLLIDKLGNPVITDEIQRYASNRIPLTSRYDSVTGTITICSNTCPTTYYIDQWVNRCGVFSDFTTEAP